MGIFFTVCFAVSTIIRIFACELCQNKQHVEPFKPDIQQETDSKHQQDRRSETFADVVGGTAEPGPTPPQGK